MCPFPIGSAGPSCGKPDREETALPSEDLGTEYHQQDRDYYCGAASAQMVLEECGAGILDRDTGLQRQPQPLGGRTRLVHRNPRAVGVDIVHRAGYRAGVIRP